MSPSQFLASFTSYEITEMEALQRLREKERKREQAQVSAADQSAQMTQKLRRRS
ncbi:hypothetical protein [Algiphilus sp.]|uniref:hypothetical protein n=1 Tax=Algiphilus sp. TaxID=1872431 RepID=UPI003CCB81DC